MLLAVLPFLVRDRVAEAIGDVAAADGRWLALAVACFVGVIVATGRAWRAGVGAVGGEVGGDERRGALRRRLARERDRARPGPAARYGSRSSRGRCRTATAC